MTDWDVDIFKMDRLSCQLAWQEVKIGYQKSSSASHFSHFYTDTPPLAARPCRNEVPEAR